MVKAGAQFIFFRNERDIHINENWLFYWKKSKDFNKNEEFRVSRTDLALFNDCPRCYYNKVFSGIFWVLSPKASS